MDHKLRRFLSPSEGFCPQCSDDLKELMVCKRCQKNLHSYPSQVYECPLCEALYCQECWMELEEKKQFTGKIATWFNRRNYGFIRCPNFNSDIFVHVDDLDFAPGQGTKVSFQIEETSKGPRARRVRRQ